jgi:hypothetical protein
MLERRLVGALVIATLVVHALYAASARVTGEDLWWTLAAGRWILEHGTVPDRDVFSYTYGGAPWSNPEWLSQVIYFALFRTFGGGGLVALKGAVVLAVVALAAWVAWRRSGSLVLALLATIAAVYASRRHLDLRAQLFMFPGTLGVLAVVEAYRRGASARTLVLLPVIMVLWANLHGSFVFGLGVLFLLAGAETAKAMLGLPTDPMPRERALQLVVAAVLATLATLVNPDGVHALILPFELLGTEQAVWRREIVEWMPPVFLGEGAFSPVLFWWLLAAHVLLAATALIVARRRFDLGDAALVAVTAVMALSARRFIPLFALVSVPFAAANAAAVLAARWPGGTALARRRNARGLAALCLVALGYLAVRFVPEARYAFAPGIFAGLVNEPYFPGAAVDFLARNRGPGRLFHIYPWGGYLAYRLPERPIFIDGRAQSVYPAAFYLEFKQAEFGYPEWSAVLDRWQVGLVLWPSTGRAIGRYGVTLDQLRQSPSWLCVYDDGHSAVFAHVVRAAGWIEAFRSFALVYPDIPQAQVFLANTLLAADEFERARQQMREVHRRFPETVAIARQLEARLLASAERDGRPGDWFGVGFYRDLRGDEAGAFAAFRTALHRGLGEPQATYARAAMERLPKRSD